MAILQEKECAACGAFFRPGRGNQLYCPKCREATGGKCYRMKNRYDRASKNVGRRFAGLDMVLLTLPGRFPGRHAPCRILQAGKAKKRQYVGVFYHTRGCYAAIL